MKITFEVDGNDLKALLAIIKGYDEAVEEFKKEMRTVSELPKHTITKKEKG